MENWALIRHLRLSEGESMRSITQRLEISRTTVAASWLGQVTFYVEVPDPGAAIREIEANISKVVAAIEFMTLEP